MSSSRLRHTTLAGALVLTIGALSSCATSHLLEWSKGEPSVFHQPAKEETVSVVRPGGTVVALPVFVVWDVVTFPFQLIWGIHPYGSMLSPDSQDW